MKYAFLIAAHTDAAQLERTVVALLDLGDVFLHIDRKARGRNNCWAKAQSLAHSLTSVNRGG